jgi:hypothetical protein
MPTRGQKRKPERRTPPIKQHLIEAIRAHGCYGGVIILLRDEPPNTADLPPTFVCAAVPDLEGTEVVSVLRTVANSLERGQRISPEKLRAFAQQIEEISRTMNLNGKGKR